MAGLGFGMGSRSGQKLANLLNGRSYNQGCHRS